ncbi:CRISPR locus-related DNA-binding protein [Metallosphaera tengchongensis]|uniref:CRISPR locus-related DNA-binding protein n=1 Tax=Metallosphaera tengchongensis TaxID=1532350 RepID=A0A6N0NX13_9CREN|nr:CRISPR-associated CARF protein Csa3 [Metallosphaera tengchongensis]QKR00735.1 CRISPR locus-related DNA-binding protein [Metallosphaera tengchongensis]
MTESKTYLSTMGFHESFMLRLLARTNASKEDELVIVVPRPVVGGVADAIEGLRATCYRMRYPEPKVEEIEVGDFPKTLSQVAMIVGRSKGFVYTNLSLGLRLMDTVILLSLISTRRPFVAYFFNETGEGSEVVVRGEEVYSLLEDYTAEDMRLLMTVGKGEGVALSDLAKGLGKSEKTVVNRVSELKKRGLLNLRGKDRGVELTELGRALLVVKLGGEYKKPGGSPGGEGKG